MPLGVSKSIIADKPKEKRKEELKLVQPATFVEKKGQIYSLSAFKKLADKLPNLSLTFVGERIDSAYYDRVLQEAKPLVEEGRIRFKEFVPYEKFYSFLDDFQAIIQPSVYARDRDCEGGAPVSILDAQARGLPLIGSRHCDIPNIASDSSILVDEKDVEGLSSAIEKIYFEDEVEFGFRSKNSIDFVKNNFLIARCGERLQNVYKSILGK